jgi:IS605 OrfB family transposase
MQKYQILTRKIKLFPIGDKEEINRVYKYIRDGQYAQWKASNMYMSNLYIEALKNVSSDDRKELHRLYGRIKENENGSAYSDISFAKGLATTAEITKRVPSDFKKAVKNGLLKGNCNIPTYKRNNPLWIKANAINFVHDFENFEELKRNINNKNLSIVMKFVNNIYFNIVFGSVNKSSELRNIFIKIFDGTYIICGSTITIDNKNSIILNTSLKIPINETELDENIVVGVDLGIAIPAMCGLNNNKQEKKEIGNFNDFTRVRTKIKNQRKNIQKSLKFSNGGHGKNKKLKSLDRFEKYEKNFVKTYNHMISKNIIDFAVKNNAKYINLEKLNGFDNSFILNNWSYFQLQQDIIYKAKFNNIIVRFINPYRTSQICSECGHWEEGQRDSQSHFKCKLCGYETNADFNASRNIAKSTDFIN